MPSINTNKLSSPSSIQNGEYKKTRRCFFNQSKLLEAQVTELFDDLWPTVTAIKNLSWQVTGYYHYNNIKTNTELTRKFVEPEDITNRPNLYRMCIDQTWDNWEFRLAKNLLTNLFALYEGWLECLVPKLFGAVSYTSTIKELQFPTSYNHALSIIQNSGNTTISNSFYDLYKNKNKQYNCTHLCNYFSVYRYFKECRNNIIHNGGFADQKLVDAYNNILSLTHTDLDVSEIPRIEPITSVGQVVKLYLRGVVGFSQIVLKIVYTLDVEFIKCENNEAIFVSAMKEFNKGKITPSSIQHRKELQLSKIIRNANFLAPQYSDALFSLLKTNGFFN